MNAVPRRHTVLSLFSGSMGLDLGLARTGRSRLLASIERDPTCCETIRVNRDAGRVGGDRSFRVYEEDVESLDPRRVMRDLGLRPGELDLLVGGPPVPVAVSRRQAWGRAGCSRTHAVAIPLVRRGVPASLLGP